MYGELARAWPGYRDVAQTAPSAETGARLQALNEEVLALAHAGTVELERVAGEPLDVFVNGTLIGRGEVVTVGDRFGVRMTELVAPDKRAAR